MSTGSIPSMYTGPFKFQLPRALTPSQLAIMRSMQAGNPLSEKQHKTVRKPFYTLAGKPVRRDAIAALLAHGLIERGAEPITHDHYYYYLRVVLRGHFDVWHWSLTAKGKELA